LNGGSGYELNPDNQQAFALRRQFEEKMLTQSYQPAARTSTLMGNRKTIEEVVEEDKQLGPPPDRGQPFDPNGPKSYHRHLVMGTLTQMPMDRPPYYPACPGVVERTNAQGQAIQRPCNKKLNQDGPEWRCAEGHVCQRPTYRYLANRVQIVDPTGTVEVSFFDEAGRQIFGCEADELAALWEDPTRDLELQQKFSKLAWKRYVFKLSSKQETWQDEQRTRRNVEDGQKPDFAKEGSRMIAEIKEALQAPPAGQGASEAAIYS
jgi:hypothetical protein